MPLNVYIGVPFEFLDRRFTLERCEFSNTYGAVAGGALETADASGTITDCIFRNNTVRFLSFDWPAHESATA